MMPEARSKLMTTLQRWPFCSQHQREHVLGYELSVRLVVGEIIISHVCIGCLNDHYGLPPGLQEFEHR
jgi:hypothetical protein